MTVSGSVSLGSGSTLQEDSFDDSNFGEQDGELYATGVSTSINLTGSTLAFSLQGNATPAIGDVITLISNQTGNAITGTFNGLPEGATAAFGGVNYQVSYIGGSSGHDVTLTVVNGPAVWTDGGGDWQWNNPANWQGNVVPLSGQDVQFPDLGSTDGTITLASNVTVGNISFLGSAYIISGIPSITVDGDITADTGYALFQSNLVLGHDTTITPVTGTLVDVTGTVSDGGNGYGITEEGSGEVALQGSNTYTGATTVDSGVFMLIAPSFASSITVNSGGTLQSNTVNVPQVTDAGGTIELGFYGYPNVLTSTGDIALGNGSTLDEVYNGSTVGELVGSGFSINLTGSALNVTRLGGSQPTVGTVWTVISNQTGNAIVGTFAGLAQGANDHHRRGHVSDQLHRRQQTIGM